MIESFFVLTLDEIKELSCLDGSPDRFFCGTVDCYQDVVLYRLGCEPIAVSHEWFKERGNPNFKDFQILNGGRVVKLGSCRVVASTIVDAWYASGFRL